MEAVLRLITAQPDRSMLEIAEMANNLTERVFDMMKEHAFVEETRWSEEVDKTPVSILIGQIEKSGWGNSRIGMRLANVFSRSNIITVGDLLRIGRHDFRKYRDVGRVALLRIDEELEELFNIQSW